MTPVASQSGASSQTRTATRRQPLSPLASCRRHQPVDLKPELVPVLAQAHQRGSDSSGSGAHSASCSSSSSSLSQIIVAP